MVPNNVLVAPPDKYFYTIDKQILTNIHQLSDYLNNCPDSSFKYHASPSRNDFYNWILQVFGLSVLADRIKNNFDKNDCARIILDYLNALKKEEVHQEENDVNVSIVQNNMKKDDVKKEAAGKELAGKEVVGKEAAEKELARKEAVVQTAAPVVSENSSKDGKDGKFREFSDEELEKFTKFGIKDKETPVDEKLDYLKTELNEIKNMIKEQRRMGKDMIITDLMLRVVEPKMSFYEFTRNHEDYEKIVRIMGDIKREIDYASQQTEVTLADEIIKQLELQSIMLKKDFTPQKQGIRGALGKIFKPANQEI